MPADRLTLVAGTADDVRVISALMQDAIVTPEDIGFDARGQRLVLIVSRYRREAAGQTRIRSALRIGSVSAVRRKDWPADPATPLALLTITAHDASVTLDFAGSTSLRAQVECMDFIVEDLGDAWPVRYAPTHD